MKFASISMLLFISNICLASIGETSDREVIVGLSGVFVPDNLSTNVDAYVVASGLFPNGCYRWGHADVEDKTEFVHEIRSFATVNQGMCLMVLVPFQKEVRFGKLKPGEHTLRFVAGDGTFFEKTMTVK